MSDWTMRNYNTSKLKLSFWGKLYSKWPQASAKQGESYSWNVTTKQQETSATIYRNGKLPAQVFCLLVKTYRTYPWTVKRKGSFNWGPEHEESFKLVKREIANAPILAYYNPRKSTVLQTDVSIKGLGVCLLQDKRPAYFASKPWQKHKEAMWSLAVAWPIDKFHHFLYANHFIMQKWQFTTDSRSTTSRWHTCNIKTHHTTRMAKQYQGSSKQNSTILGFLWRINHRGWSSIKRNKNCHTKQETRWHT